MIKNYLKEIEKLKSPISNEHTYRTPLENLLKSFAVKLYPNSNISIQQEVSAEKKIFPDFTAMDEDKGIIGFIECKDIGFDLHKAIEGNGNFKIYKEQLLKYLNKHNNLIYTDYINFIYLTLDKNQIKIKNEISLYSKDLDNNIKILENMLEDFFVYKIKEIDKKDYFLSTLARKTNILKIYIELELENKESYLKNHIKGLFEDTIFNDLSDKDFADAFSQIISFSLLFYRLNERKNVDLNSFRNMPEYIPIFREFLSTINFDNLDENIRYVINLIIKSINSYDEKIFYDKLSYKERHDTDKEDPFIYAYEYFLKEFDSKTRNARGVFYTPIEAVRYIIKSIDEILKDRLNISDGIYGEEVHILDFAAGTGTFMLGAIERAFENAKKNGISGVWENIVSDFILKRLYGFEFLIVPYVLAHFRIHEYLKDLNYDYKKNDRLQLYLTNTLDNSAGGQVKMFPQMQAESDNAYRIKNEEPILVIMGNPPYNNKSEEINRKEWIENLLKDYKENLNEKKINLDDDYIKFIRFAHWKMENAEKGIIGIIVNNSFINGLTHREMRRKLMQTFDEIYILDLHGNVNKGERCPDGSMDFNIFNIKEVGVCIALFVKTGLKNNKNKGIYFNEVFGTQDYKKNYLIDKSIADEKWVELEDDKKWHWFTKVKSNEKYLKEFIGLTEIFNLFGSGCKTERDYITIHITEEELKNTILDFNNLSENKLTEKYNTKVSRDWSVDRAKKDIMENYKKYKFDLITKINYRPFDIRYTYYTGTSKGFLGTPSRKIGYNFINRKNIGLVFTRNITDNDYRHTFITDKMIDVHINSGQDYIAPLYLYEENSADEFKLNSSCKPNWTDSFKEFLKNYISDNPKEILNYIYAILYSPTYRENYKEDLKYDYPRIPFTKDKKIFDRLQKLGEELIDLHLLKKVPQSNAGYPNKGEHKISYSKYNEEKKRLYINEKQYFENVKKEVYNYSIGGYKPIEKYIKAREILTLKDISHLIKVIAVIERTILLQEEIDKVWREADF